MLRERPPGRPLAWYDNAVIMQVAQWDRGCSEPPRSAAPRARSPLLGHGGVEGEGEHPAARAQVSQRRSRQEFARVVAIADDCGNFRRWILRGLLRTSDSGLSLSAKSIPPCLPVDVCALVCYIRCCRMRCVYATFYW